MAAKKEKAKANEVVAIVTIKFMNNGRHEVELENGPGISTGKIGQAMAAVYRAVGQSKAKLRAARMGETGRADMEANA